MTSFSAELLSEEVDEWLKIVSEAVKSPRFDEEIVEQQRNRVLREIEMYRGNISYFDALLFRSALYREHPVVTKDALGDSVIVRSADVSALRELHRRGFGGKNIDLVLVGDLPANVDNTVRDYFGKIPVGQDIRPNFPILPALESKTFLHQSKPSTAIETEMQASISLALVGVPETHPDNYASRLLFYALGGSPNSKLHDRLSSREGITYHISTEYNASCNAAVAITRTEVPARKWEMAVDVIFDEMRKLRAEGVSGEELARMKKSKRFCVARGLETNENHVVAIYEKWKTGRTLNDILNGYNAVSAEDILRVAREYLPENRENGRYVLSVRDPFKRS